MGYWYRPDVLRIISIDRSYLMDATKYKSVAIKVAVYNKARPMAEQDYCTMGGFIQKLIEQEEKKRNGKVRK
jgi:macrodomain Ter protein organizer (MatP/YcbG family)